MTTQYTVTLTYAENIALGTVAYSQQEWIERMTHDRCRIALDDIVKITVEKCLEEGIQLPSSKDAIVDLAVEKKWIQSGKEVTDWSLANPIVLPPQQ